MGALLESLSSYDTNMMLGAIIFLLLVIVFVVVLHVYAKWFLSRTGHLRRAPPAVTSLNVLPSSSSSSSSSSSTITYTKSSKGVETSLIASIPMFVYTKQGRDEDEECVICLSGFQEGEAGRRLAGCGHGFHVACIDTWLRSNSTCPVCRTPPVLGKEHDSIEVAEEEAAVVLEGVVVEENASSNNNSSSSASILAVPSNNSSSSSSSSSSSLGSSLKRMLSRNRSENSKVFPSSIDVNSAADQLDF